MALSSKQQMILGTIGVGIITGVVVGGIGGYFGLPAGVQGALTGGLVVVGLQYMRKKGMVSEAEGRK